MRYKIAFILGAGIVHSALGMEHQCFPELMSPVDYIACLENANRLAERELKQVFGKLVTVISGSSVAQAEKNKRKAAAEKAQVRWQEYRDAECALMAELSASGNGTAGVSLECQFALTTSRTKYLHDNYNIR